MNRRPENLYTLKQLLQVAERARFAVGAFSPRYTPVIHAILQAAEVTHSPVIVQVAQLELRWYQVSIETFAQEFWRHFDQVKPTVPVGLHLDHASDLAIIRTAAELGFTSVMFDGSGYPLEQNINETRAAADFAHQNGMSIEGELGRMVARDFSESVADKELYTDPREAAYFVEQTGVDALAVSVGTAHGMYQVRRPGIDLERLKALRIATPVSLVLHGGADLPADMVVNAIRLPGGGISKIDFATDMELVLNKALGLKTRTTEASLHTYPVADLKYGIESAQKVVENKINQVLISRDHALDYHR